ncbi:MAG: prealbumin-like fold domain-containing protein [Acidimicrobiia bacterium]
MSILSRFSNRRDAAGRAGRSAIALGMLVTLSSASLAVVGGPQPAGAAAGNIDLQQCANETGTCDWIQSALIDTNSDYFEGMSVPQRVLLRDIDATPGDVHTLQVSHQATKNGVHAYDWLTSYAQAQAAATAFGVPITLDECGPSFTPNGPGQTDCNAVITAGFSDTVDVPDDPFVSSTPAGPGTTATQVLIDEYETAFGNRTIEVLGDAAVTVNSLTMTHDVADEGDTGDSRINYVLTFTSAADNVLVQFAAHLAVGAGSVADWGLDLGAGDVDGASNDVRLTAGAFDGQGGSQTNPINVSAISSAVGEIRISKLVTDGDGDDFPFTFDPPGAGPSAFTVDNGETVAFPNLSPGDPYVITEGDLGIAFGLVDIVCNADADAVVDLGTQSVSIDLGPGELVTCTFINTQLDGGIFDSEINIRKIVDGGGGPAFDFNFDPATADPTAFDLSDGETDEFTPLGPDVYVVNEVLPVPGFELTGIECFDNDGVDGAGFAIDEATGTVTITITSATNQLVFCTFTNAPLAAPELGEINISKLVTGGGGPEFDFTVTPDGDPAAAFGLADGETETFGDLEAGVYTVAELDEAGFDLDGIECNDGATVVIDEAAGTVAITLAAGEVVDCTYTNAAEPDDYEDYPGDDDFDFDTPFDDAGDPGTQNPTTDVAGGNLGLNQPPAGAPSGDQLATAGETATQPPAGDPIAAAELPRTGAGVRHLTMLAGILLILGGAASLAGPRRRRAAQL